MPIAFILRSRWQDCGESLGMETTRWLCMSLHILLAVALPDLVICKCFFQGCRGVHPRDKGDALDRGQHSRWRMRERQSQGLAFCHNCSTVIINAYLLAALNVGMFTMFVYLISK